MAGIDAVEGAADAPALAQALESYFRPVAPTVRVYPAGRRPETPAELRAPAPADLKKGLKIVAWWHFGGRVNDGETKVYLSERIDDRLPPRTGAVFQGIKLQGIKPGRLQGRRVRLRAAVRAEVQPGGFAQLGLPHLDPTRLEWTSALPAALQGVDGSPWHGVGAKPTVPVSRTLKGIAAGRDEMVERAVELVAGQP